MFTRFLLECRKCQKFCNVRMHLDDTSIDWTCECGARNPVFFGLDVTVGVRILQRSTYELQVEKDYSMAIVLAAMAFESELSELFFRHTQIEELGAGNITEQAQLEDRLRHLGDVDKKIEKIAKLLCAKGIDNFVAASPQWSKIVTEAFSRPRINNLAEYLQKELFWPRNKILHQGFARHTAEQALKCWNIAVLGLQIFRDMEKSKRSTFQ